MSINVSGSLEPGVCEAGVFVAGIETQIQLSIAISLKRIADQMERSTIAQQVTSFEIRGWKVVHATGK